MIPIWTIDLIPETIVYNTPYGDLFGRWPNAGSHDGINTVFVDYLPDDENAMKVYEMTNQDGSPLSGDELFYKVAPAMFSDGQPIQLYKWQAEQLFKRVEYKLYCCNYETVEDAKADYLAFFTVELDDTKTIEELKIDIRGKLKALLS